MSALLDKMRRAREQRVDVGGFSFTIRRPTPTDMLEARAQGGDFARFVVGWSGVREIDLFEGGDPHPLEFDADACREWLRDRPDLFEPVIGKILDAFSAHMKALEAAEKN